MFLVGCGAPSPDPVLNDPPACYEELKQPSDPNAEQIATASTIFGIAVDDNGIYWSTGREVFAADKQTLTPMLVAGDQEPKSLAVHRGYLYWTNGPLKDYQVNRVRTDGSGFEVLVTKALGADSVTVTDSPGEGADHALVYWVKPSAGLVERVAVGPDGLLGGVQVIASNEDIPTWIAADEAGVFWGARVRGEIRMADVSSGIVETIVTGDSDPAELALDNDFVYWGSHGTGSIRKLPRKGNVAVDILASHQAGPDRLTVDDSHVYWTTAYSCGVMRVAKTGGEPEIIANRQPDANEIVVDDAYAYWTNFQPGSVLRVPK